VTVLEPKTSTRIALNNVLFATDFSAAAETALPYAVAICRRYGSVLHAVHVIPEFNILVHADAVNPVTFESAYEAELHDARERMECGQSSFCAGAPNITGGILMKASSSFGNLNPASLKAFPKSFSLGKSTWQVLQDVPYWRENAGIA
jgi:hypothetical protein